VNGPSSERPLEGRSVLLTRSPDRTGDLALKLEALGARVDSRSTIGFEPPRDPLPAREAVGRIRDYHWVVFTSGNGARFFHELMVTLHGEAHRVDARVAAIGPGTARALGALGLEADLVAEESSSEGLASALGHRVAAGERVLLVRPEVALEVVPLSLLGAGVRVEAVAFYRTVAAPEAGEVAREISSGNYQGVVFTSPSTFSFLMQAAGERADSVRSGLGRMRRVAIGQVTASALETAGLPPHAVAGNPDDEGILRAVLHGFET